MNNVLYIKRPMFKSASSIAESFRRNFEVKPVVKNKEYTMLSNKDMIVAIYRKAIDVVLVNGNLNVEQQYHLRDAIQMIL